MPMLPRIEERSRMIVFVPACGACCQLDFWIEILRPLPSLRRLSELGTEVSIATNKCIKCFTKLFMLCPDSPGVHRMYAKFLSEVGCHPARIS